MDGRRSLSAKNTQPKSPTKQGSEENQLAETQKMLQQQQLELKQAQELERRQNQQLLLLQQQQNNELEESQKLLLQRQQFKLKQAQELERMQNQQLLLLQQQQRQGPYAPQQLQNHQQQLMQQRQGSYAPEQLLNQQLSMLHQQQQQQQFHEQQWSENSGFARNDELQHLRLLVYWKDLELQKQRGIIEELRRQLLELQNRSPDVICPEGYKAGNTADPDKKQGKAKRKRLPIKQQVENTVNSVLKTWQSGGLVTSVQPGSAPPTAAQGPQQAQHFVPTPAIQGISPMNIAMNMAMLQGWKPPNYLG